MSKRYFLVNIFINFLIISLTDPIDKNIFVHTEFLGTSIYIANDRCVLSRFKDNSAYERNHVKEANSPYLDIREEISQKI